MKFNIAVGVPVLVTAALAAAPTAALATAAGANGRIAIGKQSDPKSLKQAPTSTLLSVLPDGSATQKVFSKKKTILGNPEYSADGTKIAFVLGTFAKESKTDGLYVANADGSGAKQVARTSWTDGVAWSPDGTTLVYTDVMDGIYSVSVAGGKPKLIVPVLDDGGFFRRPTFSPDGVSILFERDRLSGNDKPWLEVVEIWRAKADGSAAGPLFAKAPVKFAGEPDVSPDGTTLVFAGPIDKYGKRYALYTAPIDASSAPRMLMKSAKGEWIDGPAWSPDGTRIVYATGAYKTSASSVMLIDPATAATSVLVRSPKAQLTGPSWQPVPAVATS